MKIIRKYHIEKKQPHQSFIFIFIRLSDNDILEDNETDASSPPPRYLTLTDGAYKPNYYLSIPITDSILINKYNAYLDHLLSIYPAYFSSRTDSPQLHVTLLTLRIETSSQVEQCKIALKRLHEEIRYHCSYPEPLCLEFDGIGTFNDKVLYVKCKTNQRLENLRTLIVERFSEQQRKQNVNEIFFAGNYFDYLPHITLLKCKRKYSSIRQTDNQDTYFGKQILDSLQLCSIGQQNSEEEQNSNCVFKLDLN
jgi:2'-5' RNA ligase